MRNDNDSLSIEKYPSIHWEKFFNKFSEIENLSVKEWQVVHLLSYFTKKYESHYGVKYSFKFNANSPSKSYEVFQMRKLGQIISSDPEILKEYFDWFFENKIILKKKRITSLAFVTDANIANEFKFKKLAMDRTKNVDRTTILPYNILELITKLNIECKTYGDLAFIKRIVDSGNGDDDSVRLISLVCESGFDLSSLEKVR